MDSRSADPEDSFLHGLATVLQALAAVYAKITVLVLADDAGDTAVAVDAGTIAAVLRLPSNAAHGNAPPVLSNLIDVTVVPPDVAGVRVDVSAPTAVAYRALLQLQDVTGGGAVTASGAKYSATAASRGGGAVRTRATARCTVVHIAGGGGGGGGDTGGIGRGGSPGVGHYAVAARRQKLALQGVPVLAHFGAQTGVRRRADQRVEVTGVEDLEVDFMEASVIGGADAVVAESTAAAADVAALPVLQGLPDKLRRAPAPTVAPLPASPTAWRAGSEIISARHSSSRGRGKGKGKSWSECRGDAEWGEACSVTTLVFWGPLDTANGLVEFCDAIAAVLEEASKGLSADEAGSINGWRGTWAEGAPALRVEFIGKEGTVSDKAVHGGRRVSMRAGDYIEARARGWSPRVEVVVSTHLGHGGAVRHLATRDMSGVKLVVLPVMDRSIASRQRHSRMSRGGNGGLGSGSGVRVVVIPPPPPPPGVVHRAREVVAAGIALVASDEVLAAAGVGAQDRRQLRFYPSTGHGLAERLITTLTTRRGGASRAMMPHGAAANGAAATDVRRWLGVHRSLATLSEISRKKIASKAESDTQAGQGQDQVQRRRQGLGGGWWQWLGWGRGRGDTPRVTVCLIHRNRPAFLQMAVDSLVAQDYHQMDIIIVDNASDDPDDAVTEVLSKVEELMSGVGGRHSGVVIRLRVRLTLAEARNLAASKARGEFLLFMDDDNAAKPGEVSTLVTAALATGADISAPGNDYLIGDASPHGSSPAGRWLPLGAAVGAGVFKDVYGDANALIRKSMFMELGGWHVAHGRGGADSMGEDWELYARAVLQGYTLQAVPYPLFWYRQAPGSMDKTTSLHLYQERVLTPFGEQVPAGLAGALELAKTLLAERSEEPSVAESVSKAMAGAAARDQLMCAAFKHSHNKYASTDSSAGTAAAGHNLVKNHDFGNAVDLLSHFGKSTSGVVAGWQPFSDGYDWFEHGDTDLAMTVESLGTARGAQQLIHVGQSDATGPEPILLGARSRADTSEDAGDVLSADYSLYADLRHADGSQTFGYFLPFQGRKSWEWAAGVIVPDKPVASARLYLLFRHRIGTAWFDDVMLRPLTAADVCGARVKRSGAGVVFTRDTPFLVSDSPYR
jgi:GT2 family glycosyltransferase